MGCRAETESILNLKLPEDGKFNGILTSEEEFKP